MRLKQILTGDLLCNNKPVNYNFQFRGRLKDAHTVALEVLKFQFGDFIEGGASIFAGLGSRRKASPNLSQVRN